MNKYKITNPNNKEMQKCKSLRTDIMKIKYIGLVIIIFLSIFSCAKVETIYYEYNGITITQKIIDNKSYFFYGKYDKKYIKEPYLKVEPMIDDLFRAHLIFKNNKKIEIIPMESGYKWERNDTNFIISDDDFLNYGDFIDSISGKFDSIILIDNYMNNDLLFFNKRNNSKVVIYR